MRMKEKRIMRTKERRREHFPDYGGSIYCIYTRYTIEVIVPYGVAALKARKKERMREKRRGGGKG